MSDTAAEDTQDYDPEHPDPQHEPPEVCTSEPADTEPGEGETPGGDLPADIPDAPAELGAGLPAAVSQAEQDGGNRSAYLTADEAEAGGE